MANKNELPDETQQIMAKMLADNKKAAQAVIDGAQKERDRTAAERLAAIERLEEVKKDKKNFSEACYLKSLQKLKKEIRDKELENLASELLEAGEPVSEISALLDIPDGLVKNIAKDLNMELIGGKQARVSYDDQGRGGYVIFYWGKTVNQFYWEFGGGNALVVIDIPTAALWEKQTGLPLEIRTPVLEFIGTRAITDKAEDHLYRIDENVIVILR